MTHYFVGLPRKPNGKALKTYLYDRVDGKSVRQVLWGDWLNVIDPDPEETLDPDWLKVHWAPTSDDAEYLYIPKRHVEATRPLEIIFIDVGQGDGAVLITPERDIGEAIFVVDAGINGKMHEFLKKRFNPYSTSPQFHAAIVTHPDEDHYKGFEDIFSDHTIGFDIVYQNGMVERPGFSGFEKVGGVHEGVDGKFYVRELAEDREFIESLFSDETTFGSYSFAPVMHAALNNPKIVEFKALSTHHSVSENGRNWVPGFAPYNARGYAIEVLGPFVELDTAGNPQLRRIVSNYNKTKNGHSIILRLHFGDFRIFFGGDLNASAEKFLLSKYTGHKFVKRDHSDYAALKMAARNWFEADVMKVCHHGAADVTDEFIDIVGPAAFVISSGDEEGHVHPRPDLLGRLGKLGRSESPVLLSTELQRSTREESDDELLSSLRENVVELTQTQDESLLQETLEQLEILGHSNVQVYGAIYLKTDGQYLITAFRKETDSEKDKWFFFEYERQQDGRLKPIS